MLAATDRDRFDVLDMVNNNFPLGGGSVSGDLVWIGRACNGDPLENPLSPGDIAIARRGACFFSDKAANAAAAGAAAIVIANNQQDSVWSGLRIWDYSDETNPQLMSLPLGGFVVASPIRASGHASSHQPSASCTRSTAAPPPAPRGRTPRIARRPSRETRPASPREHSP